MRDFFIREIRREEIPLLEDFLYEAIFIPEDYTGKLERNIIYVVPQLYAAIDKFGTKPDDDCLVAEADGRVVGAVWVRIEEEYGHIDDETPSFSISVLKEYRGRGIGTALMTNMIERLRKKGYQRASLGVSKKNYAVRMYEKVGFRIVGDGADETEYLMIYEFWKK